MKIVLFAAAGMGLWGQATITTVAGNGNRVFSADGTAAANASLVSPRSIHVAADGTIYWRDAYQFIRKIGTDGVIRTVTGSAGYGFSGDGGPAALAGTTNEGNLTSDAGRGTCIWRTRGTGGSGKISPAG